MAVKILGTRSTCICRTQKYINNAIFDAAAARRSIFFSKSAAKPTHKLVGFCISCHFQHGIQLWRFCKSKGRVIAM
jgi:hypothetical protein